MEEKTKRTIQILILALLIILGTCFIGYKNTEASIITSATKGEIFSDDRGTVNWDGVFPNVFSNAGQSITLWCVQKGTAISRYVTAPQALRNPTNGTGRTYAGNEMTYTTKKTKSGTEYSVGTSTATFYTSYKGTLDQNSGDNGFVANYKSKYDSYLSHLKTLSNCGSTAGISTSYSDEQSTIDAIKSNLPGINNNPILYSIEYNAGDTYDLKTNQAAVYILTALKQYQDGKIPLGAEILSDAEKASGAFTVAEKQYALWELDINTGNKINSDDDRGLGNIAKEYQKFYDAIGYDESSGTDKYGTLIDVSGEDGSKNGVTKSSMTLGGETCDTYKFDNVTNVELDVSSEAYVLRTILCRLYNG